MNKQFVDIYNTFDNVYELIEGLSNKVDELSNKLTPVKENYSEPNLDIRNQIIENCLNGIDWELICKTYKLICPLEEVTPEMLRDSGKQALINSFEKLDNKLNSNISEQEETTIWDCNVGINAMACRFTSGVESCKICIIAAKSEA